MIMVSYIICALISENQDHELLAWQNCSIRKWY